MNFEKCFSLPNREEHFLKIFIADYYFVASSDEPCQPSVSSREKQENSQDASGDKLQ